MSIKESSEHHEQPDVQQTDPKPQARSNAGLRFGLLWFLIPLALMIGGMVLQKHR